MPSEQLTDWLQAWQAGDLEARDRVFALVYPELRRIARRRMGSAGQVTVQPTEIVHESFLRFAANSWTWQNRAQFFAMAGQILRQVVVDRLRHKGSLKRGSAFLRADIEPDHLATLPRNVDLLALDAAIHRLSEFDAQAARIVVMRFFGGLTLPEMAEVLETSPSTVSRRWEVARAWLHRTMAD